MSEKILILDDVGDPVRIETILSACRDNDIEAIVVTKIPDGSVANVMRASSVPVATPISRIRRRAHFRREGFANLMGRLSGAHGGVRKAQEN